MSKARIAAYTALLMFAGIDSALMSAFGLFAGAWGGFWSGKTTTERVLGMVFCVLPAMSLPAFALFFWSRPVSLVSSFAIAAGSFLALYQINVDTCMTRECTTTSPFKIALGVFSNTHIWLLTSIAIALYCAAVIANRDRQSPQPPTAP